MFESLEAAVIFTIVNLILLMLTSILSRRRKLTDFIILITLASLTTFGAMEIWRIGYLEAT